MRRFDLILCAEPGDLARSAAERIAVAAREAITARGRFSLVLSGGSTPEKTYELLARPDAATAIDWNRAFLFFGDERFVPPDNPASNYGMARRTLIERLAIPDDNVMPIPTGGPSADDAARRYGETIGRFFNVRRDSFPPPAFDLVLLGLGDDGHTASLFPGKPACLVEDRWATSSPPGRLPPPVERITLTFPILNRARQALFLVAGEKKAEVVREILEEMPAVAKYPAAGIQPLEGQLVWLLDQAAARLLKKN